MSCTIPLEWEWKMLQPKVNPSEFRHVHSFTGNWSGSLSVVHHENHAELETDEHGRKVAVMEVRPYVRKCSKLALWWNVRELLIMRYLRNYKQTHGLNIPSVLYAELREVSGR